MDKQHTNDIIHHDDTPTVGDEVGEAAGGISGVVAGAAIGSPAGPIGTMIGGIAGAIGGWWAGRALSEAAKHFTNDDDSYYRRHYEGAADKRGDWSYDQVRPAYQLGHIAGHNPEYRGRTFDAIEPDLRRGWEQQENASNTTPGTWNQVQSYARAAYTRSVQAVDRDADRVDAAGDNTIDEIQY